MLTNFPRDNKERERSHFVTPEGLGREMKGGQLTQFVSQWESLGAPPQLCSILQGYVIPFCEKPPLQYLSLPYPVHMVTPSSQDMDKVIEALLAQRIIDHYKGRTGFVSRMFLVKKEKKNFRPVFNLKALNKFVLIKKFRLISHFKVPSFLQERDYLASLDLSQAYCHVPISSRHFPFLVFIYKNIPYNWTCLPFGLASAPQAFALLTNWIASFLREKGIRTIVYLDDFLFAHQDQVHLHNQLKYVVQVFNHLGWEINWKKSLLIPSQEIEYLGLIWNTEQGRISLPPLKVLMLQNTLRKIFLLKKWSLKSAQALMGSLGFAAFAIPLGRLNLRPIQIASRRLPRNYPRRLLPVPVEALEAMRWWFANLIKFAPLHPPKARTFLSTDASDWGWGAEVAGLLCQGEWSTMQKTWHINRKELYAVRIAIRSNLHRLVNHTIVIQSDNKTVTALIRNQGGLRSKILLEETRKLFLMTSALGIHLLPFYIPGIWNTIADTLSRHQMLPDWHIMPSISQTVFQRWGVPVVDLFASQASKVVDTYVTLDPQDPQAIFIDAFSRVWNFQLAWVFPPPPLIPQVLQHLNEASGRFIIVAPRWEKVFWRADLKARALAPPLVYNNLRSHLLDLTTGRPPTQIDDMVLEIWIIQGGTNRSRGGQKLKNCF